MIWIKFHQVSTIPNPTPRRERDTPDGRRKIVEAIANLKMWCQQHEVPWTPQPSEGDAR